MARQDTPKINFDIDSQLTRAAKNKPDAGTNWFVHKGDKYQGLYLGVGKTKASWYFKGRLNGKSQQKALKATYPEFSASNAMKKIEALNTMHKGGTSANIKTVRDAWDHHCATSRSENKMSERHMIDMTAKLERWAVAILDEGPSDVSTPMIQSVINQIDTGRGDNSAATKRHVRVALSSAFGRLEIRNPVTGVTVPQANDQPPIWYDICDMHRDLDASDLSTVWSAIWAKREQNIVLGTMWVVMLFTGIRVENVASLRWSADGVHGFVDLERKEFVFPKLKSGVRNRALPFGDIVAAALNAVRQDSSEWVFPAATKTGYVGGSHGLDRLSSSIKGQSVDVIRPKDTRKFFQEACNEALLPDHVMHYLRGDKTTKGDGKMLMRYTTRVGTSAPNMVEAAMCDMIKVTPAFEVAEIT